MKLLLKSIAIVVLALSWGVATPVLAQRNAPVFHRVQVRVYLPDGITPPQVIRVQIDSERSGQPLQFRNLMRENFTEFSQVPNGEHILNVIADNEIQLETHTERFSLRSNFPLVRQFNIFLRRKLTTLNERAPGTIDATGTVSLADTNEIPKAARKAFEKGREKAGKGKSQDAIKAFEEALSHYPNYFDASNDLAVEYIKAGRYQDATLQLERAKRLSPDSSLPHLNMGIMFIEQKLYRDAVAPLSEAIRLDFNNPLSHFQLGLACFQTSDFTRAQLEFEVTVDIAARKLPLARLYLADIYKRQARNSDAIRHLEAFLRETTDNQYTEAARKELEQLKQAQP
ncbi:MAG: tetratricopeptide repeat protein [Acidobacteriota bacterium]